MRLLIVDDEAPARARLRRLLAAIDGAEVVGEAADGEQALALAEQLQPDALLLDVQMPELDGLGVAASLPDDGPAVIFVTAFDAFALQAFDARAVDYLLKPVEPERLARALQRVYRRAAPTDTKPRIDRTNPFALSLSKGRTALGFDKLSPNGEVMRSKANLCEDRHVAPLPLAATQLLVPTRQGLQVLRVADIEWLAAADNYVTLHAQGREFLLRRTLAGLLADLGEGFVRVHRSAAVALAQVAELKPNDKGDAVLTLRSGAEVLCSRAHRAGLVERLSRR